MPKNNIILDIKPKNRLALDIKSKQNQPFGETFVYLDNRDLLAGMPIPFGGAFHLTYTETTTVQGSRI